MAASRSAMVNPACSTAMMAPRPKTVCNRRAASAKSTGLEKLMRTRHAGRVTAATGRSARARRTFSVNFRSNHLRLPPLRLISLVVARTWVTRFIGEGYSIPDAGCWIHRSEKPQIARRRPTSVPVEQTSSRVPGERRCGLVPSPTRRGRYKGRCDGCSAGVPPAMLVYRRGLVQSPTRRGRYKERCDACSAGVPPAMVVYRRGFVHRPRDVGATRGAAMLRSAGVPPAMVAYRLRRMVPSPTDRVGGARRAAIVVGVSVPAGDGGVPMRVGSIAYETWALQGALRCL